MMRRMPRHATAHPLPQGNIRSTDRLTTRRGIKEGYGVGVVLRFVGFGPPFPFAVSIPLPALTIPFR